MQRLDETTASLDVANRGLEQAKLSYDEAVAGYTAEERGVARASVAKAASAIETLQAQVAELTLKAPGTAQVYQIGVESGEYISPGVPLMTLVDLGDLWLHFDLREDLVKGLKVGDRFEVRLPALGDRKITVVVRNLRVDVVDEDRTPTSTLVVQAIQSAPGVEVAERPTDLNGAMHAVRSGGAIAAVYLPCDLERDVAGGRRPQVVIFYNKQYFTPGNIAASALQAAVTAAAKDLAGRSASKASATPGPLVVEQYVLTNPALNYAQFLLPAILPTVLHVLVARTGGYVVGSEFSSRSKDEWLATAGGSPTLALTGKLAPYLAIYAVMAVIGLFIIHGFYGVPFRGDALMVGAACVLLIIAYLSLGALFQLLTSNLATGLSLTSIVCSPAFGFAGVGFPVLAGGAALLAGRHSGAPSAPALGMMRQTEIRIAPETTGRLTSLTVAPGQQVNAGDVLATLSNPELAASVEEARFALASAGADRDRVLSGMRAEEVAIAAQAVVTAEDNLVRAQAQYDRAAALAPKGFASHEQLDEDTASLAKAKADLDLKRAQHDEAVAGPTREQRELAEAKVVLAAAGLATLEAELGKLRLVSPADGTVGIQVAEPGEILVPGKPVMTLLVQGNLWFGFTLREDRLGPLVIGSNVALTAADGHSIPARVTELRPLGEFATWRAARAVGDHDLNSFRLRIEPVVATDALQPGMSVWLPRTATP